MRLTLGSKFTLPVALAGLLLVGGCSKKDQTAQQPAAQPAAQPTAPPPANAGAPAATAPPQQVQAAQPPPPSYSEPQTAQAASVAPAAPPKPTSYVIPAGTTLRVRLGETINSKTAHVGDRFDGTLSSPITVHGHTVVPAGATVTGRILDANAQGRIKGGAVLGLALEAINVNGRSIPVATDTYTQEQKGKGKRSAGFIGGGAGLGALVGGLAGGGKGALIGGLAGAGAGTAGAVFTGNKQVQLPAETVLTFTLQNSVKVR
jgi:hypothetical protein